MTQNEIDKWGTPSEPKFDIPKKWPAGVSAGQLKHPDKPYDAEENPFLPAGTVIDPEVPNWVRDRIVDYLRGQSNTLGQSTFGWVLDLFKKK